jgi:DNA-binding SARP family transcriptional activator/predicted ATPase
MADTVRLRFLGSPQVERAGQLVPGLASAKPLALLGYLAVQDRPSSREYLADLFWPDKPEHRGRANLSWMLHRVSSHLPDCLEATRHTIQFQHSPSYWLDLGAFMDLLRRGDAAGLAEAVALYRGDLMEGLHLDGCPNFEIWLVGERERWRGQAVKALRELVAFHARCGEYQQGLRYARRLLMLEPWLEDAHRQVIRLLALDGQRSAALAQYEVCHRVLAEELGVEPGPETRQLYEQICDGELSGPGPSSGSALTLGAFPQSRSFLDQAEPAHIEQPVFVARQRELERLVRFLDGALAGQGRVVFVTGDAGQGKTALIQAFARQAQAVHPDLVVAGGRGNAQTGIGDPYLPFREVLDLLTGDVQAGWDAGTVTRDQARRLLDALPLAVQALVARGTDLIDTFVPGAALIQRTAALSPGRAEWLARLERLVERKAALPADPTLQQSALFHQYSRVMQALSSRRPLLLLLDDLQWADAGSIGLLFHLGRGLASHRILIVGAYRPAEVVHRRRSSPPPVGSISSHWVSGPGTGGEAERGIEGGRERHPLVPVVNEFKRAFGDVEIALTEDDPAFVARFLDTEPNSLGAAFRETLARQTGGHPLFTIELLRGMQERGDLVQDEAGCWVEGPALDWDTLPARVEAVIAERVGRLPDRLQRLLTVASVEGETFTVEVMARVDGLDERATLQCLSEELDRKHRMVRAQGIRLVDHERLSLYRFRHILFQRYLYGSLDPVERAHLHQVLGTEMEALCGAVTEEAGDVAGQLARHFEAGGIPEKAVAYRLQAGQRATRLSAHDEAIAHFSQGLALLDTLPHSPARDERELALQVGLAVSLLPRRGYSVPEVGRAYARARELCQKVAEPPQRFQVLWLTYTYHAARGEHRTAHELGKQLLLLTQRAEDLVLEMMAHWALGWNLFFLGEFAETRDHLERAVASYVPRKHHFLAFLYGQDPGTICRSKLACVLWSLGYPQQALQRNREALALAQELSHPYSLAFAHGLASLLHCFCRDWRATQSSAEVSIRLSTKHGFAYWLPSMIYARGWALAEQGQTEEGIAQMRQGMADLEAIGSAIGCSQHLVSLANVCGIAGQVEEGLALLDQAREIMRRSEERFCEAEMHRIRGELLLAQGSDEAKVERCYQHAIEIARQQSARSWELRAVTSLCRLWRGQGKHEAAREKLAEIYRWFTEGFDTPDLQDAEALIRALS